MVGIAARPVLSNLIAGVQLALTQPIRIEDVVVVKGEFGWVEDLCSTYVVVRLWDLRRLVVPLSYFIEQPFENWTRTTANLIGTVTVYAHLNVSVPTVRRELQRILESSGMWDRQAWGLQVTDSTETAIQLRALMSATNASKLWDLRCHVREKLISFLQTQYP